MLSQKKIFQVGKEYEVSINFPSKLKDKVAIDCLSVVGDDGASDMVGSLFNVVARMHLKFTVDTDKITFKVKFGREQGYCFRIYEKEITKGTEAHKFPKPIAILHAYALEKDMLALLPL